ncbi:MAG: polysaccharide deacetylase family protein, partial [Proteobacteria bacterium]|nr:polysaccharide deacetylase family protein [Pseudomonadota bacterium]
YTGAAETEGVYFKRYVPVKLRSDYDKRSGSLHNSHEFKHRSLWANLASVIVVLSVVVTSVYSLIHNMDLFRSPIDLEPDEISKLDYTQHRWQRVTDNKLPDLPSVLAKMNMKGFIVPYNNKSIDSLFNGVNLRQHALKHWRNFAKRNRLYIKHCRWKNLIKCQRLFKDGIILVPPGYWDFELLDFVLTNGANVIAYGPPAQLFSVAKDKAIQWHGLTFEEVLKKESGGLILRGDQLLTLGFDAGLILKASSPFDGFRAISASPQAVSIGNIYDASGENETRLFAKTIGSGRLVWMDFAPDPKDHNPEINVKHLNALNASIFRYLSRQIYTDIAMWPQAKHFAALIEEDTEDQFDNARAVVDLINKKNYPISWYILSNLALKHRQLTQDMSKIGEIACHGDHHGIFTKSSRQDQVIRIARCQRVLTEITGVKPLAFRPPEEEHNDSTIDAIVNNGMTHYIANNTPDRAVPEIQVSLVSRKSLVSIPRMVSDDYEMWHTRNLNYTNTISLIDEEITWMSHIGGLYMYSFHTQFMNSPDNLNAIEHLGDKLKQLDAYFATSKNIADWWHFRTALQRNEGVTEEQFSRFNPILLSVSEEGQLVRTPYRVSKK